MSLLQKIKKRFKYEITCRNGGPYLTRYRPFLWLWPRIYLHVIHQSDSATSLHDHPWGFISLVLKGGYFEYAPVHQPRTSPTSGSKHNRKVRRKWYGPGSIIVHRARDAHRLELPVDAKGNCKPATTLVLAGYRNQHWGFYVEDQGWIDHATYQSIYGDRT